MKPKNQRLVLIAAAIAAVLLAVLLAMWGLRDRASYFYTPTDILASDAKVDRPVRLGGMVEVGSVKHGADGILTTFSVTDGKNNVLVSYWGILPDLFREGSGVVAEGRLERSHVGEIFVADTILAKHDERYMPPELGNLSAEHKVGKTLEK
jgi:cytochrome c-type biogenesis protein CcmE